MKHFLLEEQVPEGKDRLRALEATDWRYISRFLAISTACMREINADLSSTRSKLILFRWANFHYHPTRTHVFVDH